MRSSHARAVTPVALTLLLVVVPVAVVAALLTPGHDRCDVVIAVAFAVVIGLGSAVHAYVSDVSPRMVDIGGTAALALAVTYDVPCAAPLHLGTPAVVAITGVGMIAGGLVATRGTSLTSGRLLRLALPRLLTVWVLSVVVRDLPLSGGRPPTAVLPDVDGALAALALLLLTYGALLVEAPVSALALHVGHDSWRGSLGETVRENLTLGFVPASTAVLAALTLPVLHLFALPLSLVVLAFNQAAVRRHEEMLRHARQSVQALSAIPEVRGLVRPGHAARVAHTSVAIARDLGLPRTDVARIERAALLHDLGQVRLEVPRPSGATISAAPAEQSHIAAGGAEIARSTGVLDDESVIIEAQARPYHHHVAHVAHIPLGARIVKVANAYDDLLTGDGPGMPLDGPEAALERLYLGLGHEYDPTVVDALARVVADAPTRQGANATDAARS